MSKLSKILVATTATIIIGLIIKAFILDDGVKTYLVTFFFVGAGLALLRLFINAMIGKMKGKNILVKFAFFAALLSVGIPFQSWFRTEVLFAMSKSFMLPSITVLIASVVLMTIIYGIVIKSIKNKKQQQVVIDI